jgi:hypothetical protein
MNIWEVIVINTKFLTTIDDYVRLAARTLLALIICYWLHITGIWFTLVVAIGIAIDVHDIVSNALEGKPII